MKIVLVWFLSICLISSCQDKEEGCMSNFFEEYKGNQMCGLITLAPEVIAFQDTLVCGFRFIFPFWEEVDRVSTPKYIFNGYLISVGNSVHYSNGDRYGFSKIFELNTATKPVYRDTSLISLKLNERIQQYRILVEEIRYHRPLKSMIFKYKILNTSLLTPHDNLTLLVSPKYGIIGAYVSFINSGHVAHGAEYVMTYIGDIMPFSLFSDGVIFEKFQGYE